MVAEPVTSAIPMQLRSNQLRNNKHDMYKHLNLYIRSKISTQKLFQNT